MTTGQGAGRPRVSIGLPVYNGERYLEAALDSILAQTFTDFELIICDNASTDRTEAICHAASARDPRVRYIRNPVNIGAQRNHNRAFELATAPYFRWAGHDDMLKPQFLERCVATLDADPGAVLCFTRMDIIDEDGSVRADTRPPMTFCADVPHKRLSAYFSRKRVHQTIYGVIRSEALRRTRLLGDWYGSDRLVLQELAMYGCFATVDEPLFIHREHAGRSDRVVDKVSWFTPHRSKAPAGYWKHLRETARMLTAADLTVAERARCAAVFLRQGGDRWRVWAPILAHEARSLFRSGGSKSAGHTSAPAAPRG